MRVWRVFVELENRVELDAARTPTVLVEMILHTTLNSPGVSELMAKSVFLRSSAGTSLSTRMPLSVSFECENLNGPSGLVLLDDLAVLDDLLGLLVGCRACCFLRQSCR
jgi:hypothetical protein